MEEERPQPSPGSTAEENPAQAGAAEDVDTLRRLLAEEQEKAAQYLASWQRERADFLNYKRRVDQERNEMGRVPAAMLVASLLPILDDLERALTNVSIHLAGLTWVQGIGLIQRKLVAILEAQGLQEIRALGQDFDPNLHEAVTFVAGEEGKVVEVLQRGYVLNGRVLRPSMVVVGKKPQREEAPPGEGQG